MGARADEFATDLYIDEEGTAWDVVVPSTSAEETASHAINIGDLRVQAANLRDHMDLLTGEVKEVHQEAQDYDLEELARKKARSSVRSLLNELATDRGMSWADIARLVGVTPGAVRKWRSEGPATGGNRLALARLAAFLDLLEGFAIEDPAGWLELPLIDRYTVTALDVYSANRGAVLLLDYADTRISVTELLDQFDNQWRSHYRSDYDVYEAGDGQLAIRRRDD